MTRYVEERRDAFGVEPVCRELGVPVSTHYARRSRKPSRRELSAFLPFGLPARSLLWKGVSISSGRRGVRCDRLA